MVCQPCAFKKLIFDAEPALTNKQLLKSYKLTKPNEYFMFYILYSNLNDINCILKH